MEIIVALLVFLVIMFVIKKILALKKANDTIWIIILYSIFLLFLAVVGLANISQANEYEVKIIIVSVILIIYIRQDMSKLSGKIAKLEEKIATLEDKIQKI